MTNVAAGTRSRGTNKQTNSQTDRLYKHLIGINVVQASHVGDPNLPSKVTYSINFVFAQSMLN